MHQEYAKKLLNKTIDDYNKMADYFSITRPYLSEDIQALKKYAERGDRVLDLGCGNGRLTQLFEGLDIKYTGVDVSKNMIRIAKEKYPKYDFVLQNDPLKIDFPDNTFDAVFFLSVFHHIPGKEFRIKYLKEIKRVLKTNGILVLSVWNLWKRPKIILELMVSKFRHARIDCKDLFIKFNDNKGKLIADRYHYAYTTTELKKLVGLADLEVDNIAYYQRGKNKSNENIILISTKRGS